jgi:hypothetical protein
MQPKKGHFNRKWPKNESACFVYRRGLFSGLTKIKAGLFSLEYPYKVGFVTDNYKNTKNNAYANQNKRLFK